MTYYSKLIAAVVGLLIMIGQRYGLDLEKDAQAITDGLVALFTALAVYYLPNKPTTEAQVEKAREVTNEAAAKIRHV